MAIPIKLLISVTSDGYFLLPGVDSLQIIGAIYFSYKTNELDILRLTYG